MFMRKSDTNTKEKRPGGEPGPFRKTRMQPLLEHKRTRPAWDHQVFVYLPGESLPVTRCYVSELREVTAPLGRGWSTRMVRETGSLLDALGWAAS